MKNQRVDTVEKFYYPVYIFEKITKISFWISFVLSFAILFQKIFPANLHNVIIISYLLLVITQITLSFVVDYLLLPRAERERRKQFLTDSLNVPLTTEVTKNYYNNIFKPSIIRLGANTFENSLFSKEISKDMLNNERIKVLVYILVWLTFLIIRKTDLQVIVIISQTLFSSELLFNWLRLEIFHKNVETIYDNLYYLFLSIIKDDYEELQSFIIKELLAYESTKSLTRVKLSSKIFKKKNASLIQEWKSIREKLQMDIRENTSWGR